MNLKDRANMIEWILSVYPKWNKIHTFSDQRIQAIFLDMRRKGKFTPKARRDRAKIKRENEQYHQISIREYAQETGGNNNGW